MKVQHAYKDALSPLSKLECILGVHFAEDKDDIKKTRGCSSTALRVFGRRPGNSEGDKAVALLKSLRSLERVGYGDRNDLVAMYGKGNRVDLIRWYHEVQALQ